MTTSNDPDPVEPPRGKIRAVVKALRPHQWFKNILLFVPAVLAHRFREWDVVVAVSLAFACFSLSASAVYVLNDLMDIEQDRLHRSKRRRPFASGALGPRTGYAMIIGLVVISVGTSALFLRTEFTAALGAYLALTTAYTLFLKRKLIVDVMTLAALFTHRVVAGGLAADVPVSFWLLAFSMFFFTGLAFVKRYAELVQLATDITRVPGRNYRVEDIDIIKSIGPACGFMAVLVFALYINSPEVRVLYQRPDFLWLICPVLLYWISRVWFLAARSELDDDPVVFALTDRISYATGAVTAACLVAAKF